MRVGAVGMPPHVPRQPGCEPPHPTPHVITTPGGTVGSLSALPRTVGSDNTRYGAHEKVEGSDKPRLSTLGEFDMCKDKHDK
jgi:hypothetical protein